MLATWRRLHSTGSAPLRRPLGLASSGGGFRAMWNAMATTRALGATGHFGSVTHLSTVSGSSWFSSQLAFNREFFLNATAAEGSWSLTEYIRYWSAQYDNEIISGNIGNTLGPGGIGACSFIDDEWKKTLLYLTGELYMPLLNWLQYITGLLNPFIPDIETATYATAKQSGLLDVTLMQCSSIPPNAWTAKYGIAWSLDLEMNGTAFDYSIPTCYVPAKSDKDASSWLTFPLGPLIVKQTGKELMLPEDPRIATITAASSAAEGFAGSKTLATQNLRNMTSSKNPIIESCLPANLQNLAVPTDGTIAAEYPTYSLIDGGYTEVTSAAFNLGKMQADCRMGKFDCTGGLRLMISCHMKGTSLPVLFRHPGIEPGQPSLLAGYVGAAFPGNLAPMPTIFDAQFSELENWTVYVPAAENGGNASRYWTGYLTTVSNSWYNVVGGERVQVALFEANQIEVATDATPKPDTNLIIELVGKMVQQAFGDTTKSQVEEYAATNELQEKNLRQAFMQPDLADFLSG